MSARMIALIAMVFSQEVGYPSRTVLTEVPHFDLNTPRTICLMRRSHLYFKRVVV